MNLKPIHVIGGGLAGSEAAWQIAEAGVPVTLHEMRPQRGTDAHQTEHLAELVCSNSFRADDWTGNAVGLLHAEMRALGSIIMACGDAHQVPAGGALAVDRDGFAQAVTARLEAHPLVTISRAEVAGLPPADWDNVIVATGPLTSPALSQAILDLTGEGQLLFFDAIAPIVNFDSVDMSVAWRQSRYDKEGPGGDAAAYINCPMDKDQYEAFIDALATADQFTSHEFDKVPYFEGCMPIEEMARRGRESLRFGPMKPIGLQDPRSTSRPHAVVQLRMEDRGGRMWNLVGFQTRLRIPEQARVFRMIPGLAEAEFLRFGSIHRNSYVNAPAALSSHLSLRDAPQLMFAGQITGVEGYTESSATGLLAGINLSRQLNGNDPVVPPPATMMGALYRYMREADPKHFQPMNANFGLLDDLEGVAPKVLKDKAKKRELFAERALTAMAAWRDASGIIPTALHG